MESWVKEPCHHISVEEMVRHGLASYGFLYSLALMPGNDI